MPYFVMDELSNFPGIPGLFVACVFSASLSTLSSGFNALSAVTFDDFLTQLTFVKNLSEKSTKRLSKLIAMGYGLSAILLAFIVGQIDTILEVGKTLIVA